MPDNPGSSGFENQLEAWAASPSAPVPPELQRRIKASLKSSLKPVKPLPSPRTLVLMLIAVFAAGAAGVIAVLDKTGVRLMTRQQLAWMAVILVTGGVLFSFTLAWRMIPGSRQNLRLSV